MATPATNVPLAPTFGGHMAQVAYHDGPAAVRQTLDEVVEQGADAWLLKFEAGWKGMGLEKLPPRER